MQEKKKHHHGLKNEVCATFIFWRKFNVMIEEISTIILEINFNVTSLSFSVYSKNRMHDPHTI